MMRQGSAMCRRHSRIEPSKQSIKSPHPVDVEVGRRVRLQRNIIGMDQSTLPEALGVSFQQVQKYEKGTDRVGSSRLSQIAQALRVPISYFFADHNAEKVETLTEPPRLIPLSVFSTLRRDANSTSLLRRSRPNVSGSGLSGL